ncbi:unnamed protein product [Closterium sp. NIES-53]
MPSCPCALQPARSARAPPCSLHATLPCSLRAALPYSPHTALPCSPRAALSCCPHALQPACCPARAALQPARCPALQPACFPALQLARCPALQPARHPRRTTQPNHAALPNRPAEPPCLAAQPSCLYCRTCLLLLLLLLQLLLLLPLLLPTMATLNVLTFDESAERVLRTQWLTRDAAAHLSKSHPASPVRTVSRGRRHRPPPIPGTHTMALRPSSVPQRVTLSSPLASSNLTFLNLIIELEVFATTCLLDYAMSLATEPESVCPLSIGDELALDTDILEDRQFELECLMTVLLCLASMLLCPEGDPDALDIPTPRSYAEAITGEYSSQWQTAMDAEMASWKSTGTYVDKMTTPRALLHVAAHRDYELHFLDFSTAFLQGSLHEEIWLHRPPGFTESFPEGTKWSIRRPVYNLHQAPREWDDTLRTTLASLGIAPSTADPSLFLHTDPSLPPFYILVYVDGLVFATADTEVLTLEKAELQKRHTCTNLGEQRS